TSLRLHPYPTRRSSDLPNLPGRYTGRLVKGAAMNIESLKMVVDINRDGSYSLWELWEAVTFVYRLPGNLMVEGLGNIPYVADFRSEEHTSELQSRENLV